MGADCQVTHDTLSWYLPGCNVCMTILGLPAHKWSCGSRSWECWHWFHHLSTLQKCFKFCCIFIFYDIHTKICPVNASYIKCLLKEYTQLDNYFNWPLILHGFYLQGLQPVGVLSQSWEEIQKGSADDQLELEFLTTEHTGLPNSNLDHSA